MGKVELARDKRRGDRSSLSLKKVNNPVNEMLFEKQKAFQLDLEDAIETILIKHIPYNALGQDVWPDIYIIKKDIEHYDPDEPENPEDFIMVERDETNLLNNKYSDYHLVGGSDNENQK